MPEGTIVCNVESKAGDRGTLARCSGDYVIVVAHNPDSGITRIKLPSGAKKVSSRSSTTSWLLQQTGVVCLGRCIFELAVMDGTAGSVIAMWRRLLALGPKKNLAAGPVDSPQNGKWAVAECSASLLLCCSVSGGVQFLPCHHWPGVWRWAYREAHAEGRARLSCRQGQAQQLAQGSWCCYEPR